MESGYAIGNVFFAGQADPYSVRLNYGAHRPEDIESGFKRLGRRLARVRSGLRRDGTHSRSLGGPSQAVTGDAPPITPDYSALRS
ncbi:MAG: hypothetical protein HND48_04810 [Chloroflexi bacterium]|nr:hypothetical protein [Chloroflexota bacterium]